MSLCRIHFCCRYLLSPTASQPERRRCWFRSGFKRPSHSSQTMGLSDSLYNSAALVEFTPNTTRTLTHLSPSLCHAVAPSWAHRSGPRGPGGGNGLFPYVTNDVTESEEKREASGRSVGSVWILLSAKFFPCVRHEAFLCRWHDNLPAKGTARPLCRSLSKSEASARSCRHERLEVRFWGRLNTELDSSLGEVSSVRGTWEEAECCVIHETGTNSFLPFKGWIRVTLMAPVGRFMSKMAGSLKM